MVTATHLIQGDNVSLLANDAGYITEFETTSVSFTRDRTLASGTYTISGLPFQPRGYRVIAAADAGAFTGRGSIGYYNGVSGEMSCMIYSGSSRAISTSHIAHLIESIGATQVEWSHNTFTSDGVTLNFTKVGSPTGTDRFTIEFWG